MAFSATIIVILLLLMAVGFFQTAHLLRRTSILFACIGGLAAFERPVSSEPAVHQRPAMEMKVSDLQLVLIGRLLWALGEVEEDTDACQVSGSVHSLKWDFDTCSEWKFRIDDIIH